MIHDSQRISGVNVPVRRERDRERAMVPALRVMMDSRMLVLKWQRVIREWESIETLGTVPRIMQKAVLLLVR